MPIIRLSTGKRLTLNLGNLMHIKLLDVYVSDRMDSKLLGHALVQLSDKMKVLMNIFKNKDGHVFVKFPASKIGEQYKPHVEFINLNVERDINTAIGEDVSKKLSHGSVSMQSMPSSSTNEFPF